MSLVENTYNDFQVSTVTNLSDVESIKGKWNLLSQSTTSKIPYSDPEFFINQFSFRSNNSTPYIVLFEKDGIPKAILLGWKLLTKSTMWIGYFRFNSIPLNTFNVEIGGLISDGEEDSKETVLNYLEYLLVNKTFDLININHLSATNEFYKDLYKGFSGISPLLFSGKEWILKIEDKSDCDIVKLHSGKTNQTFRRQERKLYKYFQDDLNIIEIENENDVESFIEKCEVISSKSYQNKLGIGIRNSNYWIDKLKALASGKYLKGYLLISNDIPIAYYQGIVYSNTYFSYTTSFNPEYKKLSPGSFLIRKVLESLWASEIYNFHFGYGDGIYKQLYGNHCDEESTFKFYGTSIKAKIVYFFDKTINALNKKIINFLSELGVINKIKRIWKSKISS